MNKVSVKSCFQSMIIAISTIGLAYSFIVHTEIISEAVRASLTMCTETVIPSLFPFLVLSSFIIHSGLLRTSGKFLEPASRLLFNLPGEAGVALILGLIGGFPIGPKTTSELYNAGEITKLQAQRMMLFNIGGGPAFVIGTVGVAMFGSLKSGLLLYASMVFAFLILGLFFCMKLSKSECSITDFGNDFGTKVSDTLKTDMPKTKSLGEAIHCSVKSGTDAMISICAYIVIFSALTSLMAIYIKNTDILNTLTAFAEVTRGCKLYSAARGTGGITAAAGIISFAGLCIHCQVLSYVREVDLPYGKFFAARIAAAGLAALFCRAAVLIFPDFLPVISNMASEVTTDLSASVPACISLVLMSILLVLDQKP